MKLLHWGKDGGPQSTVTGYWLIEIKWLFSIALLRFGHGSRESYHSHAFGCISWLLRGRLHEQLLYGREIEHRPGVLPIVTRCSTFHRVFSTGVTWVLTFRGPWSKTWSEFNPHNHQLTTLTHGRKVVSTFNEYTP